MSKDIGVGTILLGKYRIEATLGQGGFGMVYRAVDVLLGRTVAIKTLSQSQTTLDERLGEGTFDNYLARFRREASVSAYFTQNRNIITVYGLEQDEDNFYLVLEYLDGGSLADLLKEVEVLPVPQACAITLDICEALADIHQHPVDIVHRDLKPGNILLRKNGQAVVADFGIAQVGQESQRTINAYMRHPGSPAYKSPEQANTFNYLTPASDLYSLGLILYQMLTGKLFAKFKKLPPSLYNNQIPPWLDDMVVKMLQEKPDDRYQSAEEIIQVIRANFEGISAYRPDLSVRSPGLTSGQYPTPTVSRRSQPASNSDQEPTIALTPQTGSRGETEIASPVSRSSMPTSITPPPPATPVPPVAPPMPPKRSGPPVLVFAGIGGLLAIGLLVALFVILSNGGSKPTPTPVAAASPTVATATTPAVAGTTAATTGAVEPTSTPSPNAGATITALVSSQQVAANNSTATASAQELVVARATLTALANLPTPTPASRPNPNPPGGPIQNVIADRAAVESVLKGLPGTTSSAVMLPDGRVIGDDPDQALPSASIIKLWIAATAYTESKSGGKLNLNETYTVNQGDIVSGTGILRDNVGKTYTYEQLISTMLIYSDNSAANIIIKKIGGFDRINQYIQSQGYKQTKIQRFLGDVNNPNNNFTSAQDCAMFMQRLLTDRIVDPEVSAHIRDILQTRRNEPYDKPFNFFGRKLPGNVNYAHISGTGTRVRNEVGFIDFRQNAIIIAILTNDVDEGQAEDAIASAVLQIQQIIK